ncbi:hypothetical protein L1887_00954 [Cichorium endivia]|nr:hypothetical protein L1887_00954 [Cichorium endivia]
MHQIVTARRIWCSIVTYDLSGIWESNAHPNQTLHLSSMDLLHLTKALKINKFWVFGLVLTKPQGRFNANFSYSGLKKDVFTFKVEEKDLCEAYEALKPKIEELKNSREILAATKRVKTHFFSTPIEFLDWSELIAWVLLD